MNPNVDTISILGFELQAWRSWALQIVREYTDVKVDETTEDWSLRRLIDEVLRASR